MIDAYQASMLERDITEDKCISSLKGLVQDWSPRPDGLQVRIILKYWFFMGEDIMRVVKSFNKWGTINWILKASFLDLIPKWRILGLVA